MEANSDASESDAADPNPSREPSRAPFEFVRRASVFSLPPGAVILCLSLVVLATVPARADALARIHQSGRLLYGSDMEGGGPYAYPDPRSPRGVTGFEVELMALLARDLGATPSSPRVNGTSCSRCWIRAGSTW